MRGAAIVLVAALVLIGKAQAGDPPPLKLYATPPAVMSARLSPDGTRVALIATYQGRQVLYVHSLVEGGKDGKIVRTQDFEIRWVRWKDDRHLIAGVIGVGQELWAGTVKRPISLTRLISVDADGEHVKMIGEPEGGFFLEWERNPDLKHVHPQYQDHIISMLPQSPGTVLQAVVGYFPVNGESIEENFYSVDIETGEHNWVASGDSRMSSYLLDRTGIARVAVEARHFGTIIYARADRMGLWYEILTCNPSAGEVCNPLGFTPDDPQAIFLISNRGPDRKAGLWRFDIATRQFTALIDEQADLAQAAWVEDGVLLGYVRKDGSWVYLDPAWQADYLTVRKALKGADVRIVDRTADGSHVLLEAHLPHQPKSWWLLDRTVKPLNLWSALEQYPDLPAALAAPVRNVTYKARDGLEIPAYLTLPADYKEGAIPFIVLPHGGPYACQGKEFDYESQFLASRGWGVLQPHYRGTSCYGPEFERKGDREWGGAMQDDITDGTRWLIDQHYADPSRICIVGSDYGGYAALEGVEKEPDLYRCAAAWAPVSDLTDLSRRAGYLVASMSRRIGEKGSHLAAVSPALHADLIKAPILLMHGKEDFTVNFNQSAAMEKALLDAHKPVEAIYLDHADHFRLDAESRTAWLSALDRFLGAQLGKP